MNKLLEAIRADVGRAWLVFVQSLNAIMLSLIGGALVVHQSYPDLFRQMLAAAPKPVQIGGLFLFGAVVHYALRRAKKAGE